MFELGRSAGTIGQRLQFDCFCNGVHAWWKIPRGATKKWMCFCVFFFFFMSAQWCESSRHSLHSTNEELMNSSTCIERVSCSQKATLHVWPNAQKKKALQRFWRIRPINDINETNDECLHSYRCLVYSVRGGREQVDVRTFKKFVCGTFWWHTDRPCIIKLLRGKNK